MSRDQIVRDTAYAIWEAEGKPEGRDAEHWRLAEERVSASTSGGKAKAKAPVKGKAEASAKPEAREPVKKAATKAGPAPATAAKAVPGKAAAKSAGKAKA